ncbi:MAG: hypothetical protein QOE60_703 [Thermoleophilaceae bacterium]|nr:hypothetical protein [Thermoleophilaceae bacterium]
MATHARVLDRRRLELLLDGGDPAAVLAGVDAYRNPDGGYSWGLEPDLRASESQIGGAYHAFEVFADVAPATTPRALELCDWLDSVALPDGGLPFGLPMSDTAGSAPFWAQADPAGSSLQLSAFVTGTAWHVAAHDPAVAAHPWLARSTDYCLAAIDALGDSPFAIALAAAVGFLDAVHDVRPEAAALLERLGRHIPADGLVPVTQGAEGETMRALDFAPYPDRPARALLGQQAIDADLRRLAGEQQDDGGWQVDFQNYSPAAELEWRGYMTVRAAAILTRN